jgi:hypothetical protein
MGLFDPATKTLYRDRLKKLLLEIPQLSPQEREYVKALFEKFMTGGITKTEAEKVIRAMKMNFSDELDSSEVEKIKNKILGFFA